MLTILSWNIQQGGGSRLQGIRSLINESGAKIVVLSEFRNNMSGLKLRNSLLLNGFRYQAVSSAKADANSVLIASKLPFNSHLYIDIDKEYAANVIMAEFAAFNLYGCYLPHKKKHKLFDFLINEAQKEKPIIIAGDLNSGINGVDQKGSSFWYEDEMKKLDKLGVKDAFRAKHGDVKEYSWYSHQGNGYRYDHTLVDETLLPIVKNCFYYHKVREDKLSDHSVMVLELG